MSTGERIPLAAAQDAAAYLMQEWGMAVPACMVVGSVRRKKEDVGDLELIAPLPESLALVDELYATIAASLPQKSDGLFGEVGGRLRGRAVKGLKAHFKYCELNIELLRKSTGTWHEIPVQIHRYTPANRGWIELMRTGPSDLGIIFLARWKERYGIPAEADASQGGHLRDSRGGIVDVETEEMAFEKCGLPYVPPERRAAWVEGIQQARRLSGRPT